MIRTVLRNGLHFFTCLSNGLPVRNRLRQPIHITSVSRLAGFCHVRRVAEENNFLFGVPGLSAGTGRMRLRIGTAGLLICSTKGTFRRSGGRPDGRRGSEGRAIAVPAAVASGWRSSSFLSVVWFFSPGTANTSDAALQPVTIVPEPIDAFSTLASERSPVNETPQVCVSKFGSQFID